jgi:hypothetical protein
VSLAPVKQGEPPEDDKVTEPSELIGDVASRTKPEAVTAVGSPIVTEVEAEHPLVTSVAVHV